MITISFVVIGLIINYLIVWYEKKHPLAKLDYRNPEHKILIDKYKQDKDPIYKDLENIRLFHGILISIWCFLTLIVLIFFDL